MICFQGTKQPALENIGIQDSQIDTFYKVLIGQQFSQYHCSLSCTTFFFLRSSYVHQGPNRVGWVQWIQWTPLPVACKLKCCKRKSSTWVRVKGDIKHVAPPVWALWTVETVPLPPDLTNGEAGNRLSSDDPTTIRTLAYTDLHIGFTEFQLVVLCSCQVKLCLKQVYGLRSDAISKATDMLPCTLSSVRWQWW